jgi:hypothetical protein
MLSRATFRTASAEALNALYPPLPTCPSRRTVAPHSQSFGRT